MTEIRRSPGDVAADQAGPARQRLPWLSSAADAPDCSTKWICRTSPRTATSLVEAPESKVVVDPKSALYVQDRNWITWTDRRRIP